MNGLLTSPLLLAPEGYQISRSVRLRSSASAYFSRTPASAGNRKTWTWSGWVKRGALGVTQHLFNAWGGNSDALNTGMYFNTSDKLVISGYTVNWRITTQVFRDPSSYYHIMVVLDTTQATAADRWKIYVNGAQVTAFDTSNAPTQNTDLAINQSAIGHRFGTTAFDGSGPFDGYLTEINFVDGQALTPSSFGETDVITGVWKPKKYAGTYGTNGFYLNFSDNSAATAAAIGKDYSGNGNNWTPNNISLTAGATYDSMIDVPTPWADGGNGRGNYCTWNPIDRVGGTPSAGNLTTSATGANAGIRGTMAVSAGKWYWEFVLQDATVQNHHGVWSTSEVMGSNYVGQTAGSWGLYDQNGNKRNNGSFLAYGTAFSNGDTGMVALDMDNGRIWWGRNGTWFASGDPAAGTNAAFTNLSGFTVAPAQLQFQACSYNFGQRPFAYTPPTGFKALNTQNLPEPLIKKGSSYFDATAYSGTGSTQSIVNSGGMQPDLLWIKCRSSNSYHVLVDSVRGVPKVLASNATDAEAANGFVTSLNSNGFTLPANVTTDAYYTNVGSPANTFVGWQWKESAQAGFDIVTYTGTGAAQNIAHSLGVAPRMIIAKRRNAATNWFVGHASLASWSSAMEGLNTTAAVNNGATAVFNSTAPTSSVFTVGTDLSASGGTYVAYLFSEVPGFSKFGSYTGNGSADGPFVFCGFRPRFVLIKSTGASNWFIWDSSRNTYNATTTPLFPNNSSAEEATLYPIDVLSNGFKLRGAAGLGINESATYIFAAFAENPFKNSLAR